MRLSAAAVLALPLLALIGATLPSPAGAQHPPAGPVGGSARQLIVVTTASWDATSGTLRRFERGGDRDPWRAVGDSVAVTVGRAGLAWGDGIHGAAPLDGPVKREGDGKAPAGAFRIAGAFGYAAPDSARWIGLPYAHADAGLECVDDTTSVHYNTLVRREAVDVVDWTSSERMRLQDHQYRWGVVVDHNPEGRRRAGGSCIFLHIWRAPGSPTVGCTAMDEQALTTLMRWLDPERQPVLVQLPLAAYSQLAPRWRLP